LFFFVLTRCLSGRLLKKRKDLFLVVRSINDYWWISCWIITSEKKKEQL